MNQRKKERGEGKKEEKGKFEAKCKVNKKEVSKIFEKCLKRIK